MIISLDQEAVSQTAYWKDIGIPIATFIGGFLISRFTMSKKERKEHQGQLQKNADEYQKSLHQEFTKFTNALAAYANLNGEPTLQDFLAIAQSGDGYFTHLKMIADATFAGTIPQALSYSTFCQPMKEAHEKLIPKFYVTLAEIAAKRDSHWVGEFRRGNYESIESYYEKYCVKD